MAGVEQRAIFQQAHGFGNGVQGAAATGQHGLAGGQDGLQGGQVFLFFLGRLGRAGHRAGATVNGNHGLNHRLPTPWISHGITDWVTPAAAATEFLAR
ncbi:hypothetical protein G6F54_014443 [Rhizopus delemar]|nr:hypothetical protein G6F54_014443 [Rhizopus delemar]